MRYKRLPSYRTILKKILEIQASEIFYHCGVLVVHSNSCYCTISAVQSVLSGIFALLRYLLKVQCRPSQFLTAHFCLKINISASTVFLTVATPTNNKTSPYFLWKIISQQLLIGITLFLIHRKDNFTFFNSVSLDV